MASKLELTSNSPALLDWYERIWIAAQAFKSKVERDAPACFVPSRELKELFDVLDENMDD